MVLKHCHASVSPGGHAKTQTAAPLLIQLDLRWDQEICIFNKFPRNADASGPGTTDLHK